MNHFTGPAGHTITDTAQDIKLATFGRIACLKGEKNLKSLDDYKHDQIFL